MASFDSRAFLIFCTFSPAVVCAWRRQHVTAALIALDLLHPGNPKIGTGERQAHLAVSLHSSPSIDHLTVPATRPM